MMLYLVRLEVSRLDGGFRGAGEHQKRGSLMFSLREIEDDQFIYRCQECGWESEPMTKEQAIRYPRSHQCAPPAAIPTVRQPHKAI